MKKIFAAILICLLLFAGCANGNSDTTTTASSTTKPTFPSTTSTKPTISPDQYAQQYLSGAIRYIEIKEETRRSDGQLIHTITYPELRLAENLTSAQTEIAKDLKQYIGTFLDDARDGRSFAYDVLEKYEYTKMPPYEISLNLPVSREDAAVFSILSVISGFEGGAHGYQQCIGMNYDPQTGKRLTLDQVIVSGSDDTVYEMILNKLPESIEYYDDYQTIVKEMCFADLSSTNNWCLTQDGLSFVFDPYDLAGHSYGTIIVLFPYADLTDILLPQFMPQ